MEGRNGRLIILEDVNYRVNKAAEGTGNRIGNYREEITNSSRTTLTNIPER